MKNHLILSIGKADPSSSLEDIIKSIKNKLLVFDDNMEVYPGHRESTTIGNESKKNPYLK